MFPEFQSAKSAAFRTARLAPADAASPSPRSPGAGGLFPLTDLEKLWIGAAMAGIAIGCGTTFLALALVDGMRLPITTEAFVFGIVVLVAGVYVLKRLAEQVLGWENAHHNVVRHLRRTIYLLKLQAGDTARSAVGKAGGERQRLNGSPPGWDSGR